MDNDIVSIMEGQPKILIVDDDREIRDLLCKFLTAHQLRCEAAANTHEADKLLTHGQYQLIVLDLMLPNEDGLSFCRRFRAQSSIPIIMLTAMGEETDRIVGLELGADDYLAKPFNPRELLARIRAVLRRQQNIPVASLDTEGKVLCYEFEGWHLNPQKRELYNTDQVLVTLTSGEYDLLLTFVEHAQVMLSRDELLDFTKGREGGPFDRAIDVQLSRLRRKLEDDPKIPKLIKTVRNSGYLFSATVGRVKCS